MQEKVSKRARSKEKRTSKLTKSRSVPIPNPLQFESFPPAQTNHFSKSLPLRSNGALDLTRFVSRLFERNQIGDMERPLRLLHQVMPSDHIQILGRRAGEEAINRHLLQLRSEAAEPFEVVEDAVESPNRLKFGQEVVHAFLSYILLARFNMIIKEVVDVANAQMDKIWGNPFDDCEVIVKILSREG